MSTIDVEFDGHAFVPRRPVDVPVGTQLQIIIVRPPIRQRPLADLARLSESFEPDPTVPADYASEIDHYLYGTPKRTQE